MKSLRYGECIFETIWGELKPIFHHAALDKRTKSSKVRRLKRLLKYSEMCGDECDDLVKTLIWFDEKRVLTREV